MAQIELTATEAMLIGYAEASRNAMLDKAKALTKQAQASLDAAINVIVTERMQAGKPAPPAGAAVRALGASGVSSSVDILEWDDTPLVPPEQESQR